MGSTQSTWVLLPPPPQPLSPRSRPRTTTFPSWRVTSRRHPSKRRSRPKPLPSKHKLSIMNPQLYDGRNRDFKTTSHSCAVEPHTDSFLSLLQNKAKRIKKKKREKKKKKKKKKS